MPISATATANSPTYGHRSNRIAHLGLSSWNGTSSDKSDGISIIWLALRVEFVRTFFILKGGMGTKQRKNWLNL